MRRDPPDEPQPDLKLELLAAQSYVYTKKMLVQVIRIVLGGGYTKIAIVRAVLCPFIVTYLQNV